MGCHTFIYKKISDKEYLKRFITGAIVSAKQMIDAYNDYTPGQYEEEMSDMEEEMSQYWQDVKDGLVSHDPDHVYYYFPDGRWILCNEMTFDDVINGYNSVINACEHALATYDTFDELKQFIIDHKKYYGFFFEFPHSDQYWTDTTFTDDEQLHGTIIINGEMYARSGKIQKDAFKYTPFFRVEGYPCDQNENFYKKSPAGCCVYGWDNADDLIEFLEWFKTTESGKKRKPIVDDDEVDYGDKLYDAIRNFFKVNANKNLLVHFG